MADDGLADDRVMKRDLDLIRQIMFTVQNHDGRGLLNGGQIAGDVGGEERAVNYQLKLLHEAGWIETAGGTPKYSSRSWDSVPELVAVSGVSGEGHDFLDAAGDESRWKRFLSGYGPQLAGAALGSVVQALLGFA